MQRRSYQGLTYYERRGGISREILQEILQWILCTAAAIFLAWFTVYYFGCRYSVVGSSMEPALTNGQNVLVNRLCYKVSSPKRNDVIAFYPAGNTGAHPYIKRVAAIPGDVVQILDGELIVNGTIDQDSQNYDKMEDAGIAEEPVKLGDNEYFVLGDNRNNSEDSRSAGIGMVTDTMIIGRVWLSLSSGGQNFSFVK
ncbi:MAG: signal peptidase I [Lachnospiraceae bacterium]|nr:signal peptidase I [Lachnospiraceae bacterium]